MFGNRKNPVKVWQKILGLQQGNRVKVTTDFFYFSPKMKRYKHYSTTGIIKRGTIGVVIEVRDTPYKDMRIYRIKFPNQAVWCSDLKLELVIDA